MKTMAPALKSCLAPSVLPALATLALVTSLWFQFPHSTQPTSTDTVAVPSVSAAPTLAVPVNSAPADTGLAAPSDGLPLEHEHLSRIDHLARARTLRELGDLSGALTECRRALHDSPDDEATLRTIARLGQLTAQEELAVLAFERLGHLRPEDASPLVQQARLLTTLGRYTDAVRVGEQALARDAEEPEAYQALGRAHLAAGNLSEALVRFQQAVHLAPEHGHALNNLGFTYLRANRNTEAAEVLARAAALLPHVAYVHNNLGVAYERLGRTEEAQAAYSNATRLSPRYVNARVNARRMNNLARLDVPPSSPPGLLSQDTSL
ncbi:MAG TPA: tetratricopeptide repeat protein [Myxococcaceae bacterium]|jgi:tetratricopeptide (TPR) repeat protein